MDDDAPVVVIRRRKGARPGGAALSSRSSAADLSTNGDEDAGSPVVVRAKSTAGKLAAQAKKPTRLSFGVDETGSAGDDAPKRSLKRAEFTATPSYASPAPLRLPDTAAPAPSRYSATALAELRASNQSRPRPEPDATDDASMQVDEDGTAAAIPTANAIAAARLKRETIRKLGPEHEAVEGGEDGASGSGFISLDLAARPSKKGESRLVREDDEVGEGDDDMAEYTGARERIPLGKSATEQRKKAVRAGMVDLINDAAEEDEDDDEVREWEAAQARRGDAQQTRLVSASGRAPYRPAPIPQQAPIPSLPAVQARLNAALADLQVSHTAGAETLEGVTKQRVELDEQEAHLRSEVERAGAHHAWFDDFSAWLADVVAFLDVKYPALERIEKDNLAHQAERLAHVLRKRYADDADDLAAFTGMPVPARLPPSDPSLLNGTTDDDATADAPRSSVRHARRSARAATSDGYATDDALDRDMASDLTAAVGLLIDETQALFADVQSDAFRDPDVGVRPRFAEWRARFPDSYAQSFAGLALVGVWEFWARAEMALWNLFGVPELPPSPVSLDAYQWHASLSSYAHHEHADAAHADAENDDVVAGLVGAAVVPRLQAYAREAYDPYSSRATGRALAIVEEVTYCLDRDGRKFEDLVLAFMAPIQLAVRRAQGLLEPVRRYAAEPAVALDPAAFAARDRFAARQVKLAVQALRWRRYVRGTSLPGTATALEPFIAVELVGRVLLPVLEAGARPSLAAQVIALFPPGSALSTDLANRLMAVASSG